MRRLSLSRSLGTAAAGFLLAAAPALAQSGSSSPDTGASLMLIGGLFVVGMLLLLVEIFLIPGFGVTGLSGIALIGASCYQSVAVYGYGTGSLISLGLIVVTAAVGGVSLKLLLVSKAGREFVHKGAIRGTGTPERPSLDPDLWIGRKGTAHTDLRPAGKARFDEEILEVAAEEAYIRVGTSIEVCRIEDNRPVVRTAKG